MKKVQPSSFKHPIAAVIAMAVVSQFAACVAYAGSGWGIGISTSNLPVQLPTYYANSPAGPVTALDPVTGLPSFDATTTLPIPVDSGKALRKFVDTLPGIPGITSFGANNRGQYIPVAVPEKWVDLNGVTTNDDYYEIAAVEFTELLHSDLPKATHLRGYVQLSTAANPGKHIALNYPDGSPILDAKGAQVYAYDNPNHLGPIINATKGTAIRVKFTNYLPIGAAGNLFLPVDTTIAGAGLGPDGVNSYTQNRAEIHLVGAQAPWISAGSPHQWVAPAGEAAAYAAGLGKGASQQNVPDMADPGTGSSTLYFPNDMSARFTLYEDRTSGVTRLNTYAGLVAGYFVTDPVEKTLAAGGTLSGGALAAPVTVAAGTIPADQIPLIIEDKTFVPANVAQQDALWDATHWGQPGDLWFPHVYEPNQGPSISSGVNPVGRWDFGPNFWPIFEASQPLPSGGYGAASFTPEAYMDTPVINGTAYPTLTVDPKAYRFRILNASNDRFINLGWYRADATANIAPQLDRNGNPIVDKNGVQQYFTGTEVKLLPAVAVDAAGTPATPANTGVGGMAYDPNCLCQYPALPQLLNYSFSGPTRAWPIDNRMVPDPNSVGPDFIAIGNDGGLLPNPVDIPSQPITYEANRRSVTVTNVYGYGLLVGPQERADAVVDFSAYAGQTLILYNDAPTPFPFNDMRDDYYTGAPDQTATGGTYTPKPGYGPNTRTMMQIKVNATNTSGTGGPLNATALAAALPAAYAASQPMPIVPQTAYNAAFGTTDTDNYGRVATGSAAQPTLNFVRTGALTLTGINIVSSSGVGSGSGTGYMSAPIVDIVGGGGTGATATATVNAAHQVGSVTLTNPGQGYTSPPSIVFTPTATLSAIAVGDGGTGYTNPTVTISGGGGAGATATAKVTSGGSPILSAATVTNPGSGYVAAPTVTFTGGGGSGATANATVSTSPLSTVATVTAGGSGYTAPTVNLTPPSQTGGTNATATATIASSVSATFTISASGTGFDPGSTSVVISPPDVGTNGALATATVDTNPLSANPGQILAINLTNAGAGYISAPTVTITDQFGNATATATASLAAGTGVVTGINITNAGTGYTVAPTVNITDATGNGAAATTALAGPAGTVTVVTVTNVGKGYTTAPTLTLRDANNNTSATATVGLATPNGTITGITITNPGSGYTSVPTVQITDATGVGASASATIIAAGTGAQATIASTNTTSIVALTKAEQELFDAQGRYNSTGGVELPYTTVNIQTTIPLNYTDSPTEIIGDNEAQIWKIVDNGLWTNSIHFDMNDVQLINRVGWDGTVKAPANNEVGWKDTLRLNPLEDVIVAIRAKRATVPFGQPQSTRQQDPSLPAGAAGTALTAGLPAPARFMADPNVTSVSGLMAPAGVALLTTTVNTAVVNGSQSVGSPAGQGNFDNEFAWGTAVLGHSEDDFQRPVVFNPTVVTPDEPTNLADPTGSGKLTWTDPTPAGQLASAPGVVPVVDATLANPKNELGFKILQAPVTNGAVSGPFAQVATLPANVTSWIAAVPGAYQVEAYNVAGTSLSSNVVIEGIPAAPTGLVLTPGFITPATTISDVKVTAAWQDNANNETNYVATRSLLVNGVATGTPVVSILPANTAPPSTTTTWTDLGPLDEGSTYQYDVVARNAYGSSTPVLSGTVTAPISVPLAPAPLTATLAAAVPNVKPANVTLTWTDNAFNETGYTVSRTGGAAFTTVSLPGTAINNTGSQMTYVDTTAQEGVTYTYTVCAVGTAGQGCTPVSVTSPVTIPLIPTGLTVTPSTAVDANGVYVDAVALSWTDNAFNETSYEVLRGGVVIGTMGTSANTGGTMTYNDPTAPAPSSLLDGLSYSYTVAAVNSAGAGTSAAVSTTMPGIIIAAPTNFVATPNRTGAFINLTWTNNATNATSILVQESVNGGAWVNVAAPLPATATTLRRTAAVAGNVYNFRIAALNVAQKSDSQYAYIAATLSSPPAIAAPVFTTTTPVPNVTNGSVALSWSAIAPIAGTTMSYRLNITANGVTTTIATNRTTYTFRPTAAQIAAGSNFSFTVQAVETATVVPGAIYFGSVTSLPSAPATVTLTGATAPAAPTGLTATLASATRATLSWTDNANNETSYLVRITNTTTGTQTTATVTRTAAQTTAAGAAVTYNAPVVVGNTYSYTVVAQNTKYGTTLQSAAAGPVTLVVAVPAAPTGVTAKPGAARTITVTWTDNSSNESGFTVQRATVTGGVVGTFANVGTVGANVTTFTNTGLTTGRSYQYQVRANSLVGNSAFVTSSTVVAP